jgi:HD-like signal output (HDOD) protein
MQRALDAVAAGMALGEAELHYVGVDHNTAGAYLLGLWGLPYEIVETVAGHETPGRVAQSGFDVSCAVAIAHALVAQTKPEDVPVFERNASMLGDDYLRSIGDSRTWDALLIQARALLHAVEAA